MSAGFDSELAVSESPDGKHARVMRPLKYWSALIPGRSPIIVPAGFSFDYASHPLRTARGPYNRAACVHDWLYYLQPTWCDRKLADQIFYEAMRACGVNWFQARAFYLAVRAGGWIPWGRNQKGVDFSP